MSENVNYAKEYDNSGRVKNADELIAQYAQDAKVFRQTFPMIAEYDQRYGDGLRNFMDIYWPQTDEGKNHDSPIVMFIHGGYWQRMDRSSFSHMAAGLIENNIAVAMPSYTLCPDISIAGIILEMQRACLVLYKIHRRPITVIGHSAGGHLAACLFATDWLDLNPGLPDDLVASGMGISGIYDLMPLLHTPVNNAVRMNAEEATNASPLKWLPDALNKFEAWVGGDESNEYHRQSRELAARWSLLGAPTNYVSESGKNHFTVIDALTDPKSKMVQRIVELVKDPAIEEVRLPKYSDEPSPLAETQEPPEPAEKTASPETAPPPESPESVGEELPTDKPKNGKEVSPGKKSPETKTLPERKRPVTRKGRAKMKVKTKSKTKQAARAKSKSTKKTSTNAKRAAHKLTIKSATVSKKKRINKGKKANETAKAKTTPKK